MPPSLTLADAHSNAVICSPGNGSAVAQYDILSASYAGIVPDPTPNTTNLQCFQGDGVTVMSWSRGINNGNAADAQVSTVGTTNVIWAVGKGNTFDSTSPLMGNLSVQLTGCFAQLSDELSVSWMPSGDVVTFIVMYSGTGWYVLPGRASYCCVECVVACCIVGGGGV